MPKARKPRPARRDPARLTGREAAKLPVLGVERAVVLVALGALVKLPEDAERVGGLDGRARVAYRRRR